MRPAVCLLTACFLMLADSAGAVDFITTSGSDFQICSTTFRFVGFNTRGICHYGTAAVPGSALADISTDLNFCTTANARVIRLTCAYNGINKTTTGDRLQFVLDSCQSRGIYAIVTFTDYYKNSGLYPQGDAGYYDLTGCCGLILLDHQWFQSGYTVNYLPQALYLVDRFKNHPAVFAWQLGNEIRDNASPTTFLAFAQDVATQIHAADPNHMISTGLIGYRNASLTFAQAQQLYANFSFVNSHTYDGDDSQNDSDVSTQLNKPYVIDEAGFSGVTDRTPSTNADIQKWLARGVDGYMNWGLMATNGNNGDGDSQYGIDKVYHNFDFEPYRTLYATWGLAIGPTTLSAQASSISRTVLYGDPLTSDTVTIHSISGPVNFTAGSPVGWVTPSPPAAQATCAGVSLGLQYNTIGLAPGAHTTSIQLTPSSPYTGTTISVTVTVTPPPCDFDNDGDVDQSDFARLQTCFSGVGFPQNKPECLRARLDGDNDVDSDDLARFLLCMSGADVPANAHCLD